MPTVSCVFNIKLLSLLLVAAGCCGSTVQDLPTTIDLKSQSIQDLTDGLSDVAIENFDLIVDESVLFNKLKSARSLRIQASQQFHLPDTFISVLNGTEMLFLDNLTLSPKLFDKLSSLGLTTLHMTRIGLPQGSHHFETKSIQNLSILAPVEGSTINVAVTKGSLVECIILSFPSNVEIEVRDGAVVNELVLIGSGGRLDQSLPSIPCVTLRLDSFRASELVVRDFQADVVIIENSLLENDFQLRGFPTARATEVRFSNCVFSRNSSK